jgi:hypothetical protein
METNNSDYTYDATHIHVCERCAIRYDWRKSTSSSLKMTYCGALCEQGALGFTIEALLRLDIPKGSPEPLPVDERVPATV